MARLFVACFSLSAAISVYFFARINPPDILIPFASTNISLASYTNIFGSAPSFLYTLACGLVIGACASSQPNASFHCVAWVVLCLLLEISQFHLISARLATWLSGIMPEPVWSLIGPYWFRGVFDPIDLLATIAGGLLTLMLVMHLPSEIRHASD